MIFRIMGPALGVSLVVNAGLFWAWQSARDDIAEEKASCNLETVLDELEAERIAHRASKRNHQIELNDLVSIAEREREARELAEAGHEIASLRAAHHENTITRLELEAEEDDIPDSRACLNAFMLTESINGLRVSAGDCNQVGGSGRPGAHQACAGAQGLDPSAFAGGTFSNITYADAIKLWRRDRQTIVDQNKQFAAIDALTENKDIE